MGNEEMGKWEEGTLYFTQQTADILLLQSSNVMRKSMSMHALTDGDHLCLTVGTKGVCNGIASWSAN